MIGIFAAIHRCRRATGKNKGASMEAKVCLLEFSGVSVCVLKVVIMKKSAFKKMDLHSVRGFCMCCVRFGWIEPDELLDHPEAFKNNWRTQEVTPTSF